MITPDSLAAIPNSQAEGVYSLAAAMDEAGLKTVTCRVPVVINGDTAYPVLGTGSVDSYELVPFDIAVSSEGTGRRSSITLTPSQEGRDSTEPLLVGKPIYDPDRMTPASIQAAVSRGAGYAALHGAIIPAPGNGYRFALAGIRPVDGESPTPIPYGSSEALTLVGAMRRAASRKVGQSAARGQLAA